MTVPDSDTDAGDMSVKEAQEADRARTWEKGIQALAQVRDACLEALTTLQVSIRAEAEGVPIPRDYLEEAVSQTSVWLASASAGLIQASQAFEAHYVASDTERPPGSPLGSAAELGPLERYWQQVRDEAFRASSPEPSPDCSHGPNQGQSGNTN